MIEADRIISTVSLADVEEQPTERAMRPKSLKNYIGQKEIKNQLRIFITAAKKREEALDHLLVFGPPGLGKTTLAHIIANEMEVEIKTTSGPVLEKAGDLAALLTNLNPKDILFIDEIHRLNPAIEEILYPAMEDYQLDIMIGEGPSARSIKLELSPFTLIGATTRAGALTSPLRARFGIPLRLEFYHVDDLTKIIINNGQLLDVDIKEDAARYIASCSRGTPRIANRLLKRVRDYAQVENDGNMSLEITKKALTILDVDQAGFDYLDKKLLTTIIDKFDGGPVGLDTLSAAIGEEKGTIEDVIEPFLIQSGYIHRTSKGRVATPLCYDHFKK